MSPCNGIPCACNRRRQGRREERQSRHRSHLLGCRRRWQLGRQRELAGWQIQQRRLGGRRCGGVDRCRADTRRCAGDRAPDIRRGRVGLTIDEGLHQRRPVTGRRAPNPQESLFCSETPKRRPPMAGAAFAQVGTYLMILVTRPAPTVRPPSRMAKRKPSSMATGWISFTEMSVLSPGMTISVPSGSVTTPVTSVVRK